MSELQDYAAMREIEKGNRHHWGITTALWVIVAVFVVGFFVYSYNQNCNEKVAFATTIANINGRLSNLEPNVRWAAEQLYSANGSISQVVQGVRDMKCSYDTQLFQLNNEVFYDTTRLAARTGGNNSNNGRTFTQTSQYNLASTSVAVTETCGGGSCNCG